MQIDWPNLLIGIALCVGGWTLYWIGINLAGAVVGGCLGAALGWVIISYANMGNLQPWIIPISAVLGLVIGILAMRGIHRFLFFLIGSMIGMIVGNQLFELVSSLSPWFAQNPAVGRAILITGCAAVIGLCMVYASHIIVALLTALAGSLLIVMSFSDPLALLLFIPLALGSFFLQLGVLRKVKSPKRERPEIDEEELQSQTR